MEGFVLKEDLSAPELEYRTEDGFLKARLLLPSRNLPLPKTFSLSEGPLLWPLQVHGTKILDAASAPLFPCRPEADGVFLSTVGIDVRLRFADCFPVVLSGGGPCLWILGLHCGFKGTVLGIVEKAFSFLRAKGLGPENVERAWIGPGIGPCCFDRRRDDSWTQKGLACFGSDRVFPGSETVRFDIGGHLFQSLLRFGLDENRVFLAPWCTSCHRDLFCSFRRGDRDERMDLLFHLQGGESTFLRDR
ncbi:MULTISPECIES: polyphenol oxidase family protein [Synergistales]|uniref:polyphenol oxidase family protein n=1 Tax=Synergistales TaxID=649776 RepID=UPI003899484F